MNNYRITMDDGRVFYARVRDRWEAEHWVRRVTYGRGTVVDIERVA